MKMKRQRILEKSQVEMNHINNVEKFFMLKIVVGVLFTFSIAGTASADFTLYGWHYPYGLVSIDTETGLTTSIGSADRKIEALAADTTRTVRYAYGVENLGGDNLLVSIDLLTGTVSDIGPVAGFYEITSMTFDETTSTIFALDQTTQTLLEIDPSTGNPTAIGNFARAASNALAAQPVTGDLFAGVYVDPSYLARIDKTTGASTLVGSMGSDVIAARGLSFNPETGVLFGNVGGTGPFADGRLVTIDLTSGLATPIGGPSGQITALAFAEPIPAPSAIILGSIGITFSGWVLRRRREF
jgi:hypothetical protein